MLLGKSIYHVKQGVGKCFSTDSVRGYYNDLTAKVSKLPELLGTDVLPKFKTASGEEVDFPVEIIQYGLGAYDMYLLTGEMAYHAKFIQSVEWAMAHQASNGSWNNFFFIYPEHPYGAMVQGEGASLLLRAFTDTNEQRYLDAAKQALDFMLKPVEEGGTTDYSDNGPVLLEYTHLPAVLNGWIFAWWGLYDYVMMTHDQSYSTIMEESCHALMAKLPSFTNCFWSKYDLGGHIASSHYQTIHVAQMRVMYQLTNQRIFAEYAEKWSRYQENRLYKGLAFCMKAYQKIVE